MRTPVALLLLLAALAAPATAGAVPILEGDVRLRLDGQTLRLPIVRGNLDETRGTLRLQGSPTIAGRRLSGLVVELDRRGAITAKVDGLRRKVLALDAREAQLRRGRSPRMRIVGVKVRTAGVLRGRDVRGTMVVVAAPRFVRLIGGRTELLLSQSFRDLLESEQITPGANEGAVISEDGAIAMPVAAGRLNLEETLSGNVDHGGGVTFSRGNVPDLRLTDFLLDVRSETFRARLNVGDRVGLFATPLPAPSFDRGVATFADVPVTMTAAAADAFNEALESQAFSEGLEVGTLTVRAEID